MPLERRRLAFMAPFASVHVPRLTVLSTDELPDERSRYVHQRKSFGSVARLISPPNLADQFLPAQGCPWAGFFCAHDFMSL